MSPSYIKDAIAGCEESCNSAVLEAYRIGMVESLCQRDSGFVKAYIPCATCLQQTSETPLKIEPFGLSPFLLYCSMDINYLEMRKPPDDNGVATWYHKVQSASASSFEPLPTTTARSASSTADSDISGSGATRLRWIAAPIVSAVVLMFLAILLCFFLRSRRYRERRKRQISRDPVPWDAPKSRLDKPRPPQLQLTTPQSRRNKTLTPKEKPLPPNNRSPPIYYKSPSQSTKSQPRHGTCQSPSEAGSITRSGSKTRGGGPAIWFHVHELPGSPSRWSWYKHQDGLGEAPSPSRWSWYKTPERACQESSPRWSWHRQQEDSPAKYPVTKIEPIYELDDREPESRETALKQMRAPRERIYEASPDDRPRQVSNTGEIFFV